MSNKNPKVILLMDKTIDFNDVILNMNNDWGFECRPEISRQPECVNYSFEYGKMTVVCSVFCAKFPEDIRGDVCGSIYGSELETIYDEHKSFVIMAVIGETQEELNMTYARFTRIVMAMLKNVDRGLVYDMMSRQAIQADIYMKMYDSMQTWYQEGEDCFPIDWYVNYKIYEKDGMLNGFTLGFEIFNDYEIEIYDKKLEFEALLNILTFIVLNVISRQDKIRSRDRIPVPIGSRYEEAVVKSNHSKILNKETLVILF